MMRLLIVEPASGGHHMSPYVQFLVRAAARRGWKVRLMTTLKTSKHPAFKIVEREMPGELALSIMPEIANPVGKGAMSLFYKQFKYRQAMARGFKKLSGDEIPDLIYIASLDGVDKALSVFGSPFGSVPIAGMFVSVKFHRFQMGTGPSSRSDKLYKWSFERLLEIKSLFSIAVIDEYFVKYSRQQSKPEYKKVNFVPDPGELEGSGSMAQARGQLGIPDGRFVILLYGLLSTRKGVEELLKAVSLLKDEDEISVLLAGQIDAGVETILRQSIAMKLLASGRLIILPGFQDKNQEYRVFRSANAVWLGYVGGFYGKSAVMPQAGSVGLPVLACNTGLIGAITKREDLGLVFDPKDATAVAEKIKKLQSDPQLQERLGNNGRRFAKRATAEEYGNALCTAIDISPVFSDSVSAEQTTRRHSL